MQVVIKVQPVNDGAIHPDWVILELSTDDFRHLHSLMVHTKAMTASVALVSASYAYGALNYTPEPAWTVLEPEIVPSSPWFALLQPYEREHYLAQGVEMDHQQVKMYPQGGRVRFLARECLTGVWLETEEVLLAQVMDALCINVSGISSG